MIWLSWRQQRLETLVATAMLAAIAALLVPTGLQMFSAYHDGVAACLAAPQGGACDATVGAFEQRFANVGDLVAWFTLVPGIIGVLLAAPFVSDLEHGGYRLDWTQSITRTRWIAGKLGLAVVSAVAVSAAFIALVTWWRTPLVHIQGRMNNSVFDSEGIVAIGYTLFALGLAAAIGTLWRRTVPALMSAFGVYFAVRLFVDTWLRQRLIGPLQVTWQPNGRTGAGGPDLSHAWVVQEFPSDRYGHLLSGAQMGGGGDGKVAVAVGRDGPGYMHAVYHPASHFWPLQGVEFALFAALAAALLAFAARWTARRIA